MKGIKATRKKIYLAALNSFFHFLGFRGSVEEMANDYVNRGGGSGLYAKDLLRYIHFMLSKVRDNDIDYADFMNFVRAYERLVKKRGFTISWEGLKAHHLADVKLPGIKRHRESHSTMRYDDERMKLALEKINSHISSLLH